MLPRPRVLWRASIAAANSVLHSTLFDGRRTDRWPDSAVDFSPPLFIFLLRAGICFASHQGDPGILIVALLEVSGVSYATYFAGAQFIHFLLGPATVALSIPLLRRMDLVKANLLPLLAALAVESMTAVGSVVVIGHLFNLPHALIVSMAPKSSTAAVAMAISSALGGDPSLTAALVILTGILGAVIVTPFMNAMKITDYSARGFAVGLASHGIGTARAYAVDPVAGLFAGVAMALNAVVASLVVPC